MICFFKKNEINQDANFGFFFESRILGKIFFCEIVTKLIAFVSKFILNEYKGNV